MGSTSWLALTSFGTDTGFQIEGRPPVPAGQNQVVWFRRITPGYPETMGMRLVTGRWIVEADNQDAPLGAGGSDIRGLVLKQSLTVVAIGLLLGTIVGTGVSRLMESLLFGVSPTDPWIFAVVGLTLATVSTAAAAVPARRASRVDPITVLRAD